MADAKAVEAAKEWLKKTLNSEHYWAVSFICGKPHCEAKRAEDLAAYVAGAGARTMKLLPPREPFIPADTIHTDCRAEVAALEAALAEAQQKWDDATAFCNGEFPCEASTAAASLEREQNDLRTQLAAETVKRMGRVDPDRITAWWKSDPRKPADLSFTSGPERQIAYIIEHAEVQLAAREGEVALLHEHLQRAHRNESVCSELNLTEEPNCCRTGNALRETQAAAQHHDARLAAAVWEQAAQAIEEEREHYTNPEIVRALDRVLEALRARGE